VSVELFAQAGLEWRSSLSHSASQVARIAGVSHWLVALVFFFCFVCFFVTLKIQISYIVLIYQKIHIYIYMLSFIYKLKYVIKHVHKVCIDSSS
jgi:cobalamin biosynthesis protein CobD/CbiB